MESVQAAKCNNTKHHNIDFNRRGNLKSYNKLTSNQCELEDKILLHLITAHTMEQTLMNSSLLCGLIFSSQSLSSLNIPRPFRNPRFIIGACKIPLPSQFHPISPGLHVTVVQYSHSIKVEGNLQAQFSSQEIYPQNKHSGTSAHMYLIPRQ